jgi:hypothetical protein
LRVFPRIGLPRLRARVRRARGSRRGRLRRLLAPSLVTALVELALMGGALAFALTGRRADYLDWLHPRAGP